MALSTNAQLGTSETTIYTPASESAVLSIIFYNSTATTKTVTCYAYPTGGSASATTTLFKIDIAAYNTFTWSGDEKFVLATSDKISAIADTATSVSVVAVYKVL